MCATRKNAQSFCKLLVRKSLTVGTSAAALRMKKSVFLALMKSVQQRLRLRSRKKRPSKVKGKSFSKASMLMSTAQFAMYRVLELSHASVSGVAMFSI